MTYLSFTLKRIFKNKLNLIPFVLLSIFIPFMYIGVYNGAIYEVGGSEYSMQSELESVREDIPRFENLLSTGQLNEEEVQMTRENLKIAKEREKHLDAKVKAYESEQWDKFYQSDMALIDLMIEAVQSNNQLYDADLMETLKTNKEYAKYMSTTGVGFDTLFAPVQGFSYSIRVFNYFYPLILILLLSYFASFVYCASRVDGFDYEELLPESKIKKQMSRLFVGISIGFMIIFILLVLSLICGGIGSGLGGLKTPVLYYLSDGTTKFVSLTSLLLQFLILSVLGIMFIVNLISVLSRFISRRMTCFFVMFIFTAGLYWGSHEIVPLYPMTHLLPFTYLNPIQIVTQELMMTTSNAQVNFFFGTFVLVLSNLILVVLYYWINKCRKGVIK